MPDENRVQSDFLDGAKAVSPLLPPGATVGLVTGLAASAVGLTVVQTGVMSVAIYSPSVMLTAYSLLEAGAPAVVLIVTSLVVGVRFMLLSLSISTLGSLRASHRDSSAHSRSYRRRCSRH